MLRFLSLMGYMGILAFAQVSTVPNTVKVLNETVPPGGMAQMKVVLTSPQPILTGRLGLLEDGIAGVSLFSPNGDASGTAVSDGTRLTVNMSSPGGAIGTVPEYPILTVTHAIPSSEPVGKVSTVQLDDSFLTGVLGTNLPLELKPGTLTIGGSISITDVIPGGGLVPAGGTIRVLGIGFSRETKLRLKDSVVTNAVYVSATEIDLIPAADVQLEGTLVRANNPDNSSSFYYSYMRGISDGASTRPPLDSTEPIFAQTTSQEAILVPTLGTVADGQFIGLALQNSDKASSTLTVEEYLGNKLQRSRSFTLEPRHRVVGEMAELLSAPPQVPTPPSPGAYWHIVSTSPIQMLGIICDPVKKTALPLQVSPVPSGTFRP